MGTNIFHVQSVCTVLCVCVCVCGGGVHAHAYAPMFLKSQFWIIWPVSLTDSMYVGACKNYEVDVTILSFKNVGSWYGVW